MNALQYYCMLRNRSFPFTNLCPTGETVSGDYLGPHNVTVCAEDSAFAIAVGETVNKTNCTKVDKYQAFIIEPGDEVYVYCNQDYLRAKGTQTFPFIPRWQESLGTAWMSPDQEKVTTVYGWTVVGMFLAFFVYIVVTWMQNFYGYFHGDYTVSNNPVPVLQRSPCLQLRSFR